MSPNSPPVPDPGPPLTRRGPFLTGFLFTLGAACAMLALTVLALFAAFLYADISGHSTVTFGPLSTPSASPALNR